MAQPLPLKPKLKNKNKVKFEKEILCPTPTPKKFLVGDIKGGNDGMYVIGKIGSKRIPMLVDTGASVTIVSTQFYENLKLEKPQLTQVSIKLTSASGDAIPVSEECPIQIPYLLKIFKLPIQYLWLIYKPHVYWDQIL